MALATLKIPSTTWRPVSSLSAEQFLNHTQKVNQSLNEPSGKEPGSLSLCQPSSPHWRRRWQPTPVLLPGKSHRWMSLVGCGPWSREESDTTERLHFHFSLACIGEGNGNPLQCSCLENPRDGGSWWAAIYGVAQSQTRLKRLSSSSSSSSPHQLSSTS